MRCIDIAEMRKIDDETADAVSCASGADAAEGHRILARTAARGLADVVSEIASRNPRLRISVVFGGGFNGADAVLAGMMLEDSGFEVSYISAVPRGSAKGYAAELTGDGNLRLKNRIVYPESADRFPVLVSPLPGAKTVIIDGILGIGVKSAPSGCAATAIEWINSVRRRKLAYVVSVDVPSGLDADTGTAPGDVVTADITVCMGMPKKGMCRSGALELCGSIHLAEIGISDEIIGEDDRPGSTAMTMLRDASSALSLPERSVHKGQFGHVCILGGSPGFCGAPALAGLGSLRGGAGLVSIVTHEDAVTAVASHAPEFMVRGCSEWKSEAFCGCGIDLRGKTVVIGPGMGASADAAGLIVFLMTESGAASAVVDADGLNAFQGCASAFVKSSIPLVLTPHPGEAARLLGVDTASVQNDREGALKKLVEVTESAVILKGAGTLVSAPGHGIHLIPCGNPGMACGGGVGDVLAGFCGALLARGVPAFEAARSAAWYHAAAGDFAAWKNRGRCISASDIADCINVR